MFSLKVVDTDTFLEMSPSAQNLYFHLGMRADDDGFVASPKKIMGMVNASEDDMRVLVAKNFVIKMVTNGVSVITHWHTNNLIRPDRYQGTQYQEEKARLVIEEGKYKTDLFGIPNVIPNGNQLATQVRLGKVRLGKNTIAGKKPANEGEEPQIPFNLKDEIKKLEDNARRDCNVVALFLSKKKPDIQTKEQFQIVFKRHIRPAKELSAFTNTQILKACDFAEKEYPRVWTIETLIKVLGK